VAALEIAVANVGTDAAQKARLTVSLEWHRRALAALAPDAAAALPADIKLAA
jgi:hypothetical protein